MTTTPPDITIHNLHLRYGDTTALHDLTLNLTGGTIHGLLGRNGSGKTSLLSVIAAFRKPTSGTIHVNGQPVFEHGDTTSRICLIREQGDTGDHDDTVHDALTIARHLRPNWDQDYAQHLTERFQLPTDKKLRQLSRGQRSAFGITVGLATRAPLTMFDESHLGMDAPSRQTFYDELLRDFMDQPRTIVISTHLIDEMAPLFERVTIIDHGRLLAHDDAETLRTQGATITGPNDRVDHLATGLRVLNQRTLGNTKQLTVYGQLDPTRQQQAARDGIDIAPIGLQDLFTHLTADAEPTTSAHANAHPGTTADPISDPTTAHPGEHP